ncbi:MAG TPA: alkaline phosphatase family protein [Candidatus Omnitrophota bacterium]|nr:alkaline phosphatase family protein [Candidatus Omnitrophota bacterium]HQJ15552.1 alkaline phosphatase family protein [Candidatus Omnitrophota bacterium]
MFKKRFIAEDFSKKNKPVSVLDEAVRKIAGKALPSSGQKTLILCIDGISIDKIRAMIELGKLPAFKRLIFGGVSGYLRSTIPPDSLPAWPSFTTGKNPARHGITAYFKSCGGEETAVNATMIESRKFWDSFDDAGLNSVVMNLPATYPPQDIRGIMISDYLSPAGAVFTHPAELSDALTQTGYFTDLAATKFFEYDLTRPEPFLYKIDKTLEAALSIMRNYPWDTFTLCFIDPDKAHHIFGLEGGGIDAVYTRIDESLAEIIKAVDLDNTDIFILSDHGVSNYSREFALHPWLFEKGLLGLNSLHDQISAAKGTSGWRMDLLCLAYRLKVSLNLPGIPFFHFPKEVLALNAKNPCPFDWSRTQAYSLQPPTSNYLPVFINTNGERPHGIVEKGNKYERLKDMLVREFSDLRDPDTGRLIVRRIWEREELFSGKYMADMPDLVVELEEEYIGFSGYTDRKRIQNGPVFRKFDTPVLDHSINGAFVFAGPRAQHNANVEGMALMDVMPTILYSRQLPVPSDLDGRVRTDIFTDAFISSSRIMTVDPACKAGADKLRARHHSPEDLERINRELKRMGYVK